MNYWLIKAMPSENDFGSLPIAGNVDTWYASRLPRKWKRGDLVFVWAGAPMLRIIGLADLTSPNAGFRNGYEHFRVRYRTNFIQGLRLKELRRDKIVGSASFLKSGPSGTIFPLTDVQGRRLLSWLVDVGLPVGEEHAVGAQLNSNEKVIVNKILGQGFGSPAENRRVEKAAISAVRSQLKREGWNVKSTERAKIGYDLECRRSREMLHVEVKGIRGSARSFILTEGERRRAFSDPTFRIALVTEALRRPTIRVCTGTELIRDFQMAPIAYKVVSS